MRRRSSKIILTTVAVTGVLGASVAVAVAVAAVAALALVMELATPARPGA